jgi:hypothetical protein
MEELQVKDVRSYMETIGIEGEENWFSDSEDFYFGEHILVTGIWFALDDKTGKQFQSLGEIVEFYGLPMIPENVRGKKEFEEYKRIVTFKSE